MSRRSTASFTTITTTGGLLPGELLARLAQDPDSVSGTRPEDYHLPPGSRLRDAINRSWTQLLGAWESFEAERQKPNAVAHAVRITRERWLMPLFDELGFGRLQRPASGLRVGDRDYPVSHLWGSVPIHLLGFDTALGRRTPGKPGAAGAAPHSMLQELLNRTDDHLWAILSNGLSLRLLRDNTSLTRPAYVEFDLEAMFEGQVFADFVVLWMLCHQSRFEGERPSACRIEAWTAEAHAQGVRALDSLREGFRAAITELGTPSPTLAATTPATASISRTSAPRSSAASTSPSWSCTLAWRATAGSSSSTQRATNARPPAATTRPLRSSRSCSTPPATRCWTKPRPSPIRKPRS